MCHSLWSGRRRLTKISETLITMSQMCKNSTSTVLQGVGRRRRSARSSRFYQSVKGRGRVLRSLEPLFDSLLLLSIRTVLLESGRLTQELNWLQSEQPSVSTVNVSVVPVTMCLFSLLLTVLPSHPLPHCTSNLHYSALHMNSVTPLSLSLSYTCCLSLTHLKIY